MLALLPAVGMNLFLTQRQSLLIVSWVALKRSLPAVSVFGAAELSRSRVSPAFVIMDSQNNSLQRQS